MREMQETQEYKELKGYLLGLVATDETRERVETRLMLEHEYYEDMLSVEEELIQHYVDDKLPRKEKQAFETHFLISEDRRKKVKFARNFRNYLDELAALERPQPKERFSFAGLFSFPRLLVPAFAGPNNRLWVPALASAAVLVLFSSFLLLNRNTNPSDFGVGVAQLSKAYKNGRPVGSRISEMGYASDFTLRSGDKPEVDKLALDRAIREIQDSTGEKPTAANLVSSARLYLTKKDFDTAIQLLEEAQKLAPDNAEIYNDLGVAYLEKGLLKGSNSEGFKLTEMALNSFDKALQKQPDRLDALFNRARCLQARSFDNQAREAWNKYLEYDSTSPWANEAKGHLQELTPPTSMNSDELQQNFLNAAAANNKDEAFRLASKNRELITQSYMPQKLAMSMLESDGARKSEIHQGLRDLGDIEKTNINDHFASDLADFYQDLPPEKADILRDAQAKMRDGYTLCLYNDCKEAIQKFYTAQERFHEAGDTIEEKTLAAYFIAYMLYLNDQRKEAVERLKEIDEFSREHKYAWISLMSQEWLIGGQASLGQISPTDTKNRFQAVLKQADDMQDEFMRQKFYRSLIDRDLSVKTQDDNTFAYIQKIFEYSTEANVSFRQNARGLDCAIRTLISDDFTALPKVIARENIASIEKANAPLRFVVNAQKTAGMVYTQLKDFPEAEKLLTEAKNGAEMEEGSQRQEDLTEILLSLGNLESKRSNFPQAIQYYNESLQIQTGINTPKLLYETRKLRLLAYEAQGNDAEIDKDLPETIPLAEEKRIYINSEKERNSFFNSEQQVYDIAIAHEFRGNNTEKAYNYAETSSSRSLLDWLQKDAKKVSAAPLSLDEIREQMPANVQLLQYTVLKKQVLIWIISREKFELVSSAVSSEDLKNKVDQYVKDIISPDQPQHQDQAKVLSQELYGLLIAPALPYLDKGRQVCIIPNKMLFNLPFKALMSPEGRYFLQEFAVFYSTSANVFILSTQQARNRAGSKNEALLSVGNPAFDRQQLPDLKDLPQSAAEAWDIAKNYVNPKPKILTNQEATKDAFREAMENADVIQFAGHYLVNREYPLSSELVMAKSSDKEEDNFFTNGELQQEKLPRAKLVVLSACQTGVEGYDNSEGLIGLSRIFLARGVPLVVASQWRVDSAATAQLMKKFHRYRKQNGLSTVNALQKAQLEMIDEERFSQPFYWASFAVFGGYADF